MPPNIETFLHRKDLYETPILTSVNIVNVSLTGSSSYTNGIWTVKDSGGPTGFFFVYQQMTGDGSIMPRILDVQNTDPNADSLHARVHIWISRFINTSDSNAHG